MKKIAIVYSFNTQKTSKIAKRIREAFGKDADVEMVNVETVTTEEFLKYDNLICGTSTWFDGELPNHWDEFVPALEDMYLKGKRIALFGLGDQKGYPENFLDGMGILAEILEAQGAKLVGFTSTEGYTYESSRAERGDQFVGLGIDFETQGARNKERVNGWVEKLKLELK
jgi:flavodoxin I